MTSDVPVTQQSVPISERTRQEIWRLVTEALPTTCLAHAFGRPQMRRWAVDRTMERLAAGEGAARTLEVLVSEECGRCPSGWSGGRPALHAAGEVPFGTYSPPRTPHGYWEFEPLGMFVQEEGEEWHYRRRAGGAGRERFPWMVAYVGYEE